MARKSITVTGFLLAVGLCFSTAVSANYEVIGSGASIANGLYTYAGTYDSWKDGTGNPMPYYRKTGTNFYLGYRGCAASWAIVELINGPAGGGIDPYDDMSSGAGDSYGYRNTTYPSSTPPFTGWEVNCETWNDYGSFPGEPAPTIAIAAPPTPNPSTWLSTPYELNTSSIRMVATNSYDPSTPVQYRFYSTGSTTNGGGGSTSGWTTNTTYTDYSLGANHNYCYRVRARDSAGMMTELSTTNSTTSCDYTDIETPIGITFGTITGTSIQARSTNTPDGLTRGSSGLYIRNNTTSAVSGWKQNNNFWTSSGLAVNTLYNFRAIARNGDANNTGWSSYFSRYTLANQPISSLFSNVTNTTIRTNWAANGNPAGTQYYCENTTRGTNSGWTTATSWNSDSLSCGVNYSFRIRARNGNGVTTGWTSLGSIMAGLDGDGDGTPDCLDSCPADSGKTSPGICGCGVPDTDSDGDGTPDCNDDCDNTIDSDGDGVSDCDDGCPDDPLKIDPGICGCGTPDTDSDSDGTPDCIDLCPDDILKISPGVCGCGILDTDSDGDGTANCIDLCPDDPLKIESGICGCGTPEDDSDGDSTLDCLDNCPDDPAKIEPGACDCGTADEDTDDDGYLDCADDFPEDPTEWIDSDGDGRGDNSDTDDDGDNLPDLWEEQYGLLTDDATGINGGNGDWDLDGWTNRDEYVHNFDPTDGMSPPPIPPEVVEVIPANGAGIANSTRVPVDASFAIRIKDLSGIDTTESDCVEFLTAVDGGVAVQRDLDSLNSGGDKLVRIIPLLGSDTTRVNELWIVYDLATEDSGLPPLGSVVEIEVTARDRQQNEMATAAFSFQVETSGQHDQAMENMPAVMATAIADSTYAVPLEVYVVDDQASSKDDPLVGAAIVYEADGSESCLPGFGPLFEIPPLTAPYGAAVGVPVNLEPPTVFNTPVKIYIPCPGCDDLTAVDIYKYDDTGWSLACDRLGHVMPGFESWMVKGSRLNDQNHDPPRIEISVYHFSAVQAAKPAASESGNSTSIYNDQKLGCFVATAVFGSSMEDQVAILREFRNRYLNTNRPGRTLVDLYYRHSQAAAQFISRHKTAKVLSRWALAPMVVFAAMAVKLGVVPSALISLIFVFLIFMVTRLCFSRIRNLSAKAES